MVSVTIAGLHELSARFQVAGQNVRNRILKELERLALMGQAKTVSEKLQGNPLHHRTGNLSRAVQQSAGTSDEGDRLIGYWGVTRLAPYGAVHEMGGVFHIPEHTSTSRLGNAFSVRAHDALFPQRAFLGPTLLSLEPTIRTRLAIAAREAFMTEEANNYQ